MFPADCTTAGLLLLAELPESELNGIHAAQRYQDRPADRPDLASLRADLLRIRRKGFAVNRERSERGLVAAGVAVRDANGTAQAGLAVSMPSVRYNPQHLPAMIATLQAAARRLEGDLALCVIRLTAW